MLHPAGSGICAALCMHVCFKYLGIICAAPGPRVLRQLPTPPRPGTLCFLLTPFQTPHPLNVHPTVTITHPSPNQATNQPTPNRPRPRAGGPLCEGRATDVALSASGAVASAGGGATGPGFYSSGRRELAAGQWDFFVLTLDGSGAGVARGRWVFVGVIIGSSDGSSDGSSNGVTTVSWTGRHVHHLDIVLCHGRAVYESGRASAGKAHSVVVCGGVCVDWLVHVVMPWRGGHGSSLRSWAGVIWTKQGHG